MSKVTRATRLLEQAGVAFTVHSYEYDPDAASIGLQAAEALGEPPDRVLKTLMALADGKPELGRQVLDEVDYMTALTNRLLLLARAERREVALDRRAFDIGEITRAAAERCRLTEGQRRRACERSASCQSRRVRER